MNGKAQAVLSGSDVVVLPDYLGLDGRKVAVELNETIVPRCSYAGTVQRWGDRMEIVLFTSGGGAQCWKSWAKRPLKPGMASRDGSY